MSDRMHPEDIRWLLAGMVYGGTTTITAEQAVHAAGKLLAELERTAKPEPVPEPLFSQRLVSKLQARVAELEAQLKAAQGSADYHRDITEETERTVSVVDASYEILKARVAELEAERDAVLARVAKSEPEPSGNPGLLNYDEIMDGLKAACTGHPHAMIPWPHRVLHEAHDAIGDLRARVKELEAAHAAIAEAIAQGETENAALRSRVTDLESENATLHFRVAELEAAAVQAELRASGNEAGYLQHCTNEIHNISQAKAEELERIIAVLADGFVVSAWDPTTWKLFNLSSDKIRHALTPKAGEVEP